MPPRKKKLIIPPNAQFGDLSKLRAEQAEAPVEEGRRKDKFQRRKDIILRHLKPNGLHFDWGVVPIGYTNLDDSAEVDRIFGEWQKHTQARGEYIASHNSCLGFQKRLSEAKEELGQTTEQSLRFIILDRIQALESLIKTSRPKEYVAPQKIDNENFEDWFPTKTKFDFTDVSEDVVDLCHHYLSATGLERAGIRRKLSDLLLERKANIPEGMTAEDFAKKVMEHNLPF